MREPNGLLAIGGDLSLSRLLRAYAQGIFPWYNPDEPILWWSPDPRTVMSPDGMKVSRSLRRAIQREDYAVTIDQAFSEVLDACAAPRQQSNGTWLGEDMRRAYRQMHAQHYAHSVEIWRQGELVGGLYGIAIGKVYFGESMFSRADNASKIALYWLCRQLQAWAFELIDCQVSSAHLQSLGAEAIPRLDFQRRLAHAIHTQAPPPTWQFTVPHPCAAEHRPPP